MAEISDLIDFAVNKNPVEFASAFDEIVRGRVVDAIENRRIEMAASLYGEADDTDYTFEDDTLDDLDLGDDDETSDLEDTDNDEA